MLNSELAKQMNKYLDYSVSIEEIHHTKKLDAPSGTAISLADGIRDHHQGYKGWCFENDKSENMIPIRSIREGSVPGIHTVIWDSEIDTLSLRHEAKNRKGLSLGAIVAAEFIHNRKGVFKMSDVLGF
jgi:4-hydroxy-tetrahydrodipicolinate reductase